MKFLNKIKFNAFLILIGSFLTMGFSSCNEDDSSSGPVNPGNPTITSMTYDLAGINNNGVSGTVTFEEKQDNSVSIIIDLNGTSSGESHPSHIHDNSAAEGGGIAISLNPVDGVTGMSETTVTTKDDGSPITYSQLVNYNGYVNVHLSASDLSTLIAQGDIGQNDLTGDSKVYDLAAVSNPNISGTATFSERVNNNTLVTVELNNDNGGDHPIHIHANTAAEGGQIAITLNNVVDGLSKTNVIVNDDGNMTNYSDLVNYDGYVNVHLSANDLATLVAQGDIGQNDLTGNMESYTLNEVDIAGISGTAMFMERVNGETLVSVKLNGSLSGDHPMHIHEGSVATSPGSILITLTSVDANGISKTNVTADDMGNMINYSMMSQIDGYINVHNSPSDLGTLIAQGNVGINAQ